MAFIAFIWTNETTTRRQYLPRLFCLVVGHSLLFMMRTVIEVLYVEYRYTAQMLFLDSYFPFKPIEMDEGEVRGPMSPSLYSLARLINPVADWSSGFQ